MKFNIRHNIILIILTIAIVGCKPADKPSTTNSIEAPSPTDLGDLYKYYHSEPKTLDQKDENTIIEYLADNNINAIRTQSGVYISRPSPGIGAQLTWGEPITVDYKGYFLDGKEFDSSYKRGEPISFRVGSMVAGWNEALPHLNHGESATLFLPSHMGYGPKGFPGFVGPDRILVFDIEIYPAQENSK